MVISHHSSIHNKGNTIQLSERDRRHDTDEGVKGLLSFRNFAPEESNKGRKTNLDLLEEDHKRARIDSKALKRRVEYKYKTKAYPHQIENKLSSKWISPYQVIEVLVNGVY